MESPEPVEVVNRRLEDYYGIDSLTGKVIWRIVWSDDQFEKRLTNYTNDGFELLYPEVREVPKYRQWIQHKFVLERLTIVPEMNEKDIPTGKLSYEPLFVFEDRAGNPLPPKWEAAKFVVEAVNAATGKSSMAKYLDPDGNPEDARERAIKEVDDIETALFGQPTENREANNPVSVGYTKTKGDS